MISTSPAALDGIRVLDFTRVLAGPYCTMSLGDLGAEIIKVENPAGGDETRRFLPPDIDGESTYFLHVNRNKKSVVIDLSQPAGKEVALELAHGADVLVENFRPGVMQRLGLDYDTVRAGNKGIIYCSVSGYGTEGPFSTRAGLDPVIQGECGLMALTGEPDGEPMRIGVSLVDAMTGVFASQTILGALVARGRSGEGQRVEVSLFDTGVNMLVNFGAAYLMAGVEPERPGNGNLVAQPSGVYHASDGRLVVTCANQAAFERLCVDVLDAPELLADPRFGDNPGRLAHTDALSAAINERLGAEPRARWLERLRAAGIPGGEVRTVSEALTSEEFASRGLLTEVTHPTLGALTQLRSPMRLAGTPVREPESAPTFGQHTREVLQSVLGYDEARLAALDAAGVIQAK